MSESVFASAIRESRVSSRPLLAFNVVDLASLQGVLHAAREKGRPVVVQWSARTVQFYGAPTVRAAFRAAKEDGDVAAFLHLDHCSDDAVLGEALNSGFDGIMADGSHLPVEENCAWTRDWTQRAHDVGAVIEGELGVIRGIEDGFGGIEDPHPCVDVDSYLEFSNATGVDLLGAEIGTVHGLYQDAPTIRFGLLEELFDREAPGFVVHGCSGLSREIIRRFVKLRAVKLNYSTNLKLAWGTAMKLSIKDTGVPEPVSALGRAREATIEMARRSWDDCGGAE